MTDHDATNETFVELRSMVKETVSVLCAPEDQQTLQTYMNKLNQHAKQKSEIAANTRVALRDIQAKVDASITMATARCKLQDHQGVVEQLQERMMCMGKKHHKLEEDCGDLTTKNQKLTNKIQTLKDKLSRAPEISKEQLPKEKYSLDLYQMITHIEWDMKADESTIKGVVVNEDSQEKDFLLMTSQSHFFVANYLWDMV